MFDLLAEGLSDLGDVLRGQADYFLWGIRFNNHREWFLEHKQDYLDYVYNPLKELEPPLNEQTMKKALPTGRTFFIEFSFAIWPHW